MRRCYALEVQTLTINKNYCCSHHDTTKITYNIGFAHTTDM